MLKSRPSKKTRSADRARSGAVPPRRGFPRNAVILALLVLAVSGAAYYVSFLRERTSPFGDSDRPTEPWNILLISLDTTRPDYLAACASGPVATPSLDRVAGGGFVLSSMISPAPITLPSHASLLTGLNPNRHGVRENTEYALPDDAITAAETFRSHGYRTQAFVSAFVMDGRFGLEQGFDDYVDDLVTSIIELLGSAAASLSETGGEGA